MGREIEGRELRLAEVVGAVARQALADWGAGRVALLDDGSPEAGLAARLLTHTLGAEAVVRVGGGEVGDLEPVLHSAAAETPDESLRTELRRLRARLVRDAVTAAPDNKTTLLLGGPLPPEPLLPLGDLYASEVGSLAGGWSAPPAVRALAERAGGIGHLDAALRERYDRRNPAGLGALPDDVAEDVARAVARGRASRVSLRLVPKIGYRTLGVDLFE